MAQVSDLLTLEQLDAQTWRARLPEIPGMWATGPTKEAAISEWLQQYDIPIGPLQETLQQLLQAKVKIMDNPTTPLGNVQTSLTALQTLQPQLDRALETIRDDDQVWPDQCRWFRTTLRSTRQAVKQLVGYTRQKDTAAVLTSLPLARQMHISYIDELLGNLLTEMELYQSLCEKVTRQAVRQRHTVLEGLEEIVPEIQMLVTEIAGACQNAIDMHTVTFQLASSAGAASTSAPLHAADTGNGHHFCNECGAANKSTAKFCYACGESMSASLVPTRGNASAPGGRTTRVLPTQMLLKGRYRILQAIGQGGFGAVYQAADTQFGNRLVAIKEMLPQNLDAKALIAATTAFQQEALLLAGLMHPNLPRIYEQFGEAGRSYLIMDYIDGETVEQLLRRTKSMPIATILDIALQLCSVLDYLHTSQPPIIFRDLKPANIMRTKVGHIYLIDFGIARHFKPGQAKDTVALGSPGYAAPEQYGKEQTTPRADIYSLGATLHQLFTRIDPSVRPFAFPMEIIQQVISHNPALTGLDALLTRMVAMDVNKRPASVAQVKHDVQTMADQYKRASH